MTQSLLIGVSRSIALLRLQCPHLAAWGCPIVVVGRTGTGKGVLVDEICRYLPPDAPFARIAATASRHSLLYSTLFGFLKGAFTGADRDCEGLLAVLSGGVLFLDDFQDINEELQLHLVDITDGKPLWPLGAKRPMTPKVRIIVGTQRPLVELWRKGPLREDLFERLNGVTVAVPPLADRPEDIPVLAAHLLARLAEKLGRPLAGVADDVLALLQQYTWPRNVRELERVLERAAFLAYNESMAQPLIEARHLDHDPFAQLAKRSRRGRPAAVPAALLVGTVQQLGSTKAAAQALGLTQRTVQRQLRRAGQA